MRKCSIAVLLLFWCALAIAQQTLTNDYIVKMAKAGLSDDLILSSINASPGKFDVTTDGIIALKRGGVSDKVVSAILLKTYGNALTSVVPPPTSRSLSSVSENDVTARPAEARTRPTDVAAPASMAPPVAAPTTKHNSQTILVCDEGAGCAHQFLNGRKIKTLTADDISVSVSIVDTGKYFRADIAILNTSTANINVLPGTFTIQETAPKEKVLASVDVGKIIHSAQRRMAWGNALAGMGAGMQRQQTTTNTTTDGTVNVNSSDGTYASGTYSGTSTSTTSAPDYAAQARTNEAIRQRNALLAIQSSQLSDSALRSNTVPPGQTVSGCVFFERKGKATSIVLLGPIGEKVFKFPFVFQR
jgi:hypothetical protein